MTVKELVFTVNATLQIYCRSLHPILTQSKSLGCSFSLVVVCFRLSQVQKSGVIYVVVIVVFPVPRLK